MLIEWQSAALINPDWMSPILIGLSGFAFAIFHSLTATFRCKAWFEARGMSAQYYRLLYSIVAVFTTMLWLWLVYELPDVGVYASQGWLWWWLVGLQVLGGMVAFAAFWPIDGAVFLGLRQAPESIEPFVVSGIYRWIRHPMYSGVMLFLWASPNQSVNSLSVVVVVCCYFIWGARFEEKRMLAQHPDYAIYQQHVPAFIPKMKR